MRKALLSADIFTRQCKRFAEIQIQRFFRLQHRFKQAALLIEAASVHAQGKFPPESLKNVQAMPEGGQ